MSRFFFFLFISFCCIRSFSAVLSPEEVAVVYNADSALSKEAMERYCSLRRIPQEQVIALHALSSQDVSRADFDIKMRMDILFQAQAKGLMWPAGSRKGKKLMRALVLMPDLPLRVQEDPTQPAGRISDSTPGNRCRRRGPRTATRGPARRTAPSRGSRILRAR